ncbi:hypothetical protein NEMBOFW57_003333 [Staphylotrichum longicolle]|uniref:Uncharacterized protein n=1 Tax=Staphylotrichum longicolle TaxID=669026 RepID=A0AAD4F7N3_9PEZI|nr:hypothetical protein NEMBOFW57_003333 [Staphylotrichum longicolle]
MIVNSGKLDEALPKWRDRIVQLQPALEPGHLPIAQLIAGTPRVFRYFAAAAHEATRSDEDSQIWSEFEIKDELELEQVRDIAILSHQYKAIGLISENVFKWIVEFVPLAWEPEKHMMNLQKWIEKENLELDKAQTFPSLPTRSPLNYLETMPATKTFLTASHGYNQEVCGSAALVAKLGKDGKTRLLRWAMEKGDEARPVMDEHISYIAEQKEKINWGTYTNYTI